VHVWVDETRPRNQGAALTAWELGKHGVPHTGRRRQRRGPLMQHGRVDIVVTGTDRVTRRGDVANKIGTYLKALAARDNGVPFWVALPHSTIDWRCATACARSRSRSARGRGHRPDRPHADGGSRPSASRPRAARPPTRPST
jgi:methylthioribose-1-phosphate isomerase